MKNLVLTLSASVLLLGGISCSKILADTREDKGAFEYRDIYLPDYTEKNNEKLGLDIVDNSWGLWGHNLRMVLPDNPSSQVFAKAGGGILKDQFCFSSDKLYQYIVSFINNNYLFSDSIKFAILPNDNEIVCQCTQCVSVGNKAGDASPALYNMIEKLSKKFPQHEFFTSYYLTTKALPERPLPHNAGVLISAIDYPLSATETNKELSFINTLNEWNDKTDRIYVWDYINNFDDYFTPTPIFSIMQRRLKLYRDAGVKGVFLNGSGNDYSTFSDIKKAVLAQMLENPDLDWEELLRKYANENYPTAGNDIADFMILQEKTIEGKGKILPIYEGVYNVRSSYLPEQEFIDFYNKLLAHRQNAGSEEKEKLRTATDAMALTMLELKRIHVDMEDTEKLKKRLGRMEERGVNYYNEGAWPIEQYLNDYEYMEKIAQESEGTNKLKGMKVRPITALDEDYTDVGIVTDGLLGLPSNYHNGNLITSADPSFSIGIPRPEGAGKLRVWLVYSPGFKIGLPAEAYISVGGVRGKRLTPEKPQGASHTFLDFDIPTGTGDLVLTLVKDPDVKTMAIDEIEAF